MSKNTILQFHSGTIGAKLAVGEQVLVDNVSFGIEKGERLAIVGETGSGKTMLAHAIIDLLPANVERHGGKVETTFGTIRRGRNVVYIPQSGMESLNPGIKIRRQMYDSLRLTDIPRKEYAKVAEERLRSVGLDEPERVLNSYPFQLSGGMAKRVTLAIAACAEAELVIADEPTSGIGYDAKMEFAKLLDMVFPEAAVLVITHDFEVAAQCNRVLVLCKGHMVELGPTQMLLDKPKHPYTRTLIESLVKNGMKARPILREAMGVCPFYDRCEHAEEACLSQTEHHADGGREWWCNAND